jgi:hypothetical protein
MGRARRILAITAGLVVFGAVAGAIAGALVAMLGVAIRWGPFDAADLSLAAVGAGFGAPLGAVLLPAAGWLLMRHVPLGRAMLGTTLGTVAGGLIGWVFPSPMDQINRTLLAGLLGFVLAVVLLRLASRRDRASVESPLA